ncbi:MAG: CoA transferase [Deltaproteobacteria bacterium]|nr:MAG: CoA transferase [Deltaproteobacteria bacterium]
MTNKEYPLHKCRVLDLSDERGFLCGKILAELGMDVILVEPPGGHPARNIGPFYHDIPDPEKSLFWFGLNSSKKGITLDIASEDGKVIFKKLVKRSDFVIESYLPGYLSKLGIGYTELEKLNPRLSVVSITAFGQKNPLSRCKASDLGIMAMSGFMSFLGDADRAPVRVSFPQSYMWGGSYAAIGALIAHHYQELTGEGQHVDVSLQAATGWAAANAPYFWKMGINTKREGIHVTGRSFKGATFPGIHQCRDGYLAWLIYGGRAGRVTNEEMVKWLDEHEMAPDYLKEKDWAQFDPGPCTQEEFDQIIEPISKFLRGLTKREYLEEVTKRRIMGYPVSTARDILENPHLQERKAWKEIEHPELGHKITYPDSFAKFSEVSSGIRHRAPLIGEHNEDIYLKELEFSRDELIRLKEANII